MSESKRAKSRVDKRSAGIPAKRWPGAPQSVLSRAFSSAVQAEEEPVASKRTLSIRSVPSADGNDADCEEDGSEDTAVDVQSLRSRGVQRKFLFRDEQDPLRCLPLLATSPLELPFSVTHLDLSRTHLDAQAVSQLCAAVLQPQCSLRVLDLSNVRSFGGDSALQLAQALARNESVSELDLHGCPIDESGGRAMSALLASSNRTLTALDLSDCDLTVEACKALTRAMRTNFTVVWLAWAGSMNRFWVQNADLIVARLARNSLIHLGFLIKDTVRLICDYVHNVPDSDFVSAGEL